MIYGFDHFWPVDWEALREVEETNKGDAGEKQPVFLEGAVKNMEFNIYIKRYFHQESWQCYHKFSSGRDKHELRPKRQEE